MPTDVIHLSIKSVRASTTEGASGLKRLIGYISGERSFGGVQVGYPHEPWEIAYYGGLGVKPDEALALVERINLAEMRRDMSGYQLRGGRRKKRIGPRGEEIIDKTTSQGPTLARSIDVALPWGVPATVRLEIVHEFARYLRATFGGAVLYAAHNKAVASVNDGHFIITDRDVDDEGKVGKKIRGLNTFETNARARAAAKAGCAGEIGACETLRVAFTRICNEALKEHGAPEITHLSYRRRGLDIAPQKKRSRTAEMREARIAARRLASSAPYSAVQYRTMRQLRKKRLTAEAEHLVAVTSAAARPILIDEARNAARAIALEAGPRANITVHEIAAREGDTGFLNTIQETTPIAEWQKTDPTPAGDFAPSAAQAKPGGAELQAASLTAAPDNDAPPIKNSGSAAALTEPKFLDQSDVELKVVDRIISTSALSTIDGDAADPARIARILPHRKPSDIELAEFDDLVDPEELLHFRENPPTLRRPSVVDSGIGTRQTLDNPALKSPQPDQRQEDGPVSSAGHSPAQSELTRLDLHSFNDDDFEDDAFDNADDAEGLLRSREQHLSSGLPHMRTDVSGNEGISNRPRPSQDPTWDPATASDVDKRLIRAFIDKSAFSDEWRAAFRTALGALFATFKNWWKHASRTAQDEIKTWKLPRNEQLSADLRSRGVAPPSRPPGITKE